MSLAEKNEKLSILSSQSKPLIWSHGFCSYLAWWYMLILVQHFMKDLWHPLWPRGQGYQHTFFILKVYRFKNSLKEQISQPCQCPKSLSPIFHANFCWLLTHCSRETRKTVIGKQCRPRSDAAECSVWSGSPLFANCLAIFLKGYVNLIAGCT